VPGHGFDKAFVERRISEHVCRNALTVLRRRGNIAAAARLGCGQHDVVLPRRGAYRVVPHEVIYAGDGARKIKIDLIDPLRHRYSELRRRDGILMHLSVAQEHTAEKYGTESHRPEQKPRKIAAEALGIDKILFNFAQLVALPHLVVEDFVL